MEKAQVKLFLERTIKTEFARNVLKAIDPPLSKPTAAETAQRATTGAEQNAKNGTAPGAGRIH